MVGFLEMRALRGLTFKLVVGIVAGCGLIYGLIQLDQLRFARGILEAKIENEARNVTATTAERIEAVLLSVERAPRNVAGIVVGERPTREGLWNVLRSAVASDPNVFGAAMAFEPNAFAPGVDSFSPYCFREGADLACKDLGEGDYAYEGWDWYRLPRERQRPVWVEPYFDVGGGDVLMTTFSLPVIRQSGSSADFIGIATADVTLDWLQDYMAEIRVARTGYGFLVTGSGMILTHPDASLVLKRSLNDLAEERADPALKRVAERMASGQSGFEMAAEPTTGKPGFLGYRPLLSGWSLVVVFPERELREDVDALRNRMMAVGLVGGLGLAVVIGLVSRRITRPLGRLARATREVAAGRLDAELPTVSARDEVGQLTSSFRAMQSALQGFIEEVRRSAADQERLESELRIAREIQMSLAPRASQLTSERLRCDVFGLLEPARQVGGDLYDVLVRGREVCFAIGDVSDKGIPAALFMAVTNTIFKDAARELTQPDEILARVNRQLASEGGANMFVTLLCGALDPASGHLSIASGGHTPPVLVPSHGLPRLALEDVGTVVGVIEEIEFHRVELHLAPGDALILYTDGVTEAHDPDQQLFGEERLLASLSDARGADARTLAETVLQAVRHFSRGVPQFDDIAIVVIRRPPLDQGTRTLRLASDLSEIARADEWLELWCRETGIRGEPMEDLRLALEEIVANVVRHGYGEGQPGEIEIRVGLAGDTVRLEVRDHARPFNLLEAPGPDLEVPLDDRPSGGLGVHLVRRLMDRVDYAREEGENRLILERRRDR
jgi:sigma-B regulation protein RsbU (phosphoserine phosphatase)